MEAILQAIRQAGSQSALAKALGVTPPMIYQLATGRTAVSVQIAVRIEQKFGISRRDLRPSDWWAIWPELIDDAHPAPPTATDPTEQQAA